MKKTNLTSITLLLISLSFNAKAQQTYMPVFGNDITRYYSFIEGVDGSLFCSDNYIRINDSIAYPIEYENYDEMKCYHYQYHYYVESEDHSKLWGIDTVTTNFPAKRDLLMDLNLKVGEVFIDPFGCSHVVDSVYTYEGRKHIRFEKQWKIETTVLYYVDYINNGILAFYGVLQIEFIEGVGNNFCFHREYLGAPTVIPWLCAQYKDGRLSYQPRGFLPLPNTLTGSKVIEGSTGLVSLMYVPASGTVTVNIVQTISLEDVEFSILDINGRTLHNGAVQNYQFEVGIHENPSGIYFLQLKKGKIILATNKFIKT